MNEVSDTFLELCGKLRDEEITDTELARLEARLRENADERAYYLKFIQIDALLEKFPPIVDEALMDEALTRDHRVRRPFSGMIVWMAAAAALTLAFILGTQALRKSKVPDQASRPGKQNIGTLVLAKDCRWGEERFSEGQRLVTGLMELTQGTALIRFDGGAEAVLKGPVALQLEGPMAASLLSGELVIRASEGAEGFILDTPSGKLIDLGTEFAVKVEPSGSTELHVHEGEVALGADYAEHSGHVIAAGKAVRLEGALEEGWSGISLNAPRFRELIQQAQPRERRDLMTAYEGFHVDPGVYPPRKVTGGKGWNGPWRLRNESEKSRDNLVESTDQLTISMSKMEVSWPIKGGQLGMLEMPEGPNVWIRKMKKPIRMEKWGIRYFSFLVTEPDVQTGVKESGRSERQDLRFTFRSSSDYFGESLSIGWERSLRPRLATDSGPASRAIRSIPGGQTIFCVAKIESRKSAPDRISFRFYTREEPLDIVEPAEWDVTMTDVRQNATFDLLVLTSHSQKVRYLDEIRIGPSWRSVTPIDRSEFMISSTPTP